MKKNGMVFELLYGIAGIALGTVLLFTDGAAVLSMITKLVGVFMLIVNLPKIVIILSGIAVNYSKAELIAYLFGAMIGAVVLFLPVAAVTVGSVLAGIWFIVLPVVDIINSEYRSEQFRLELPKLIIGAALLVLGPMVMFSVLIKILGGVIFIFSVVFLVRLISRFSK